MSNECQLKRGFFTLQNCQRPAAGRCQSCGLFACEQHLSARTGTPLCASCAEKQNQLPTGDYDDYWMYSYRDRYYSQGYSPFRYSQHDYNSFDRYADDATDFDDDAGGDFSDS